MKELNTQKSAVLKAQLQSQTAQQHVAHYESQIKLIADVLKIDCEYITQKQLLREIEKRVLANSLENEKLKDELKKAKRDTQRAYNKLSQRDNQF